MDGRTGIRILYIRIAAGASAGAAGPVGTLDTPGGGDGVILTAPGTGLIIATATPGHGITGVIPAITDMVMAATGMVTGTAIGMDITQGFGMMAMESAAAVEPISAGETR